MFPKMLDRVMDEEPGAGGAPPDGDAAPPAAPTLDRWREALPAELAQDKSLADIKDVAGLASSYVSAQKMLGGSVRIPSEDAGTEAKQAFLDKLKAVPGVTAVPSDPEDKAGWDAFYAKLGRPEDPAKYEFQAPEMPEGYTYDPALEGEFRGLAHQAGLTQAQFRQAMDWYMGKQQGLIEQVQQQQNQAKEALEKEWGEKYEAHMGLARTVVRQFGGEDLVSELESTGLGNNPRLAKFLATVGAQLVEDPVIKGTVSDGGAATASEIRTRIAEIRNNPEHPYHDRSKPGHAEAVTRLDEYYRQLAAMQGGGRAA